MPPTLLKAHAKDGQLVLDEPLPAEFDNAALVLRVEKKSAESAEREALLNAQMPAFLRGDEDEDASDLF
jgi:hypothetical protein